MPRSYQLPRAVLTSSTLRRFCTSTCALGSLRSPVLSPGHTNIHTYTTRQYIQLKSCYRPVCRSRGQAYNIIAASVKWHARRVVHSHSSHNPSAKITETPTFVRADGHLTANGSCIYTQRQALTQSANLLRTDRYAQHSRSVESSIRTRSYIEARTVAMIRGNSRRTRIRKRKPSKKLSKIKNQKQKDRLSSALAETYTKSYAKAKMHAYARSQSRAHTQQNTRIGGGLLRVYIDNLLGANTRYKTVVRYSTLYAHRSQFSTTGCSAASKNARVHKAHSHAQALASYADEEDNDLLLHAHAFTQPIVTESHRMSHINELDCTSLAATPGASAQEKSKGIQNTAITEQSTDTHTDDTDIYSDKAADVQPEKTSTASEGSSKGQRLKTETLKTHTKEASSSSGEARNAHPSERSVGYRNVLKNEGKRVAREWDNVLRAAENVRHLDRRGVMNAEEGEKMCVQLARLLDISTVCTEEEINAKSIANTIVEASQIHESGLSQSTLSRLRAIDLYQLRTLSLAIGVYVEHPSMNPVKAARNRDPAVRRKLERNNVYAQQRVLCAKVMAVLRQRASMLSALKPDVFAHAAVGLSRAAHANESYTNTLIQTALACVDDPKCSDTVGVHESADGVARSETLRKRVGKRRKALLRFAQALHNEYNHLVDEDAEAEGQLEKAIRIRNKKIRIRDSEAAQEQAMQSEPNGEGEGNSGHVRGDSVRPASWQRNEDTDLDADAEAISAASDTLQRVRARRLDMLNAHAQVLNAVLSDVPVKEFEPLPSRSKRTISLLERASKRLDVSYSQAELDNDAHAYVGIYNQREDSRGVYRGKDECDSLGGEISLARMDLSNLTALTTICNQCKELYNHALGEVNSYVEVDGRLPGGNWHARAYELDRSRSRVISKKDDCLDGNSVHACSKSSASPRPEPGIVGIEKYLTDLEALATRANMVASRVSERTIDLMMERI